MDMVEEVAGEVVEDWLVEAETPEEVGVEAAHGDGETKPLDGQGLQFGDFGAKVRLFPTAPDGRSPHVELFFAELEERSDLNLLGVQFVAQALQHPPAQHLLEQGVVALLVEHFSLPHQEPPARQRHLPLLQQVSCPHFYCFAPVPLASVHCHRQ